MLCLSSNDCSYYCYYFNRRVSSGGNRAYSRFVLTTDLFYVHRYSAHTNMRYAPQQIVTPMHPHVVQPYENPDSRNLLVCSHSYIVQHIRNYTSVLLNIAISRSDAFSTGTNVILFWVAQCCLMYKFRVANRGIAKSQNHRIAKPRNRAIINYGMVKSRNRRLSREI